MSVYQTGNLNFTRPSLGPLCFLLQTLSLGDLSRPHALALNLLAGVLSEMGDPQSANYVVQDALVICRKLQDEELEV